MSSRYLNAGQLAGLVKVGDILIPGDGDLPSFSASGAAKHVDRTLEHLADSDRSGLQLVLGTFRFLPTSVIQGLLRLSESGDRFGGPLGTPLRTLNVGVRGAILSLYYSDVDETSAVLRTLGWDPHVVEHGPDQSGVAVVSPKPPPEPLVPRDAPAAAGALGRARAATPALRRLTAEERARYLTAIRQVMGARRPEIERRIEESGLEGRDAISEVDTVLENLGWLEEHADEAAVAGYELGTVLALSGMAHPFYEALVPIAMSLLTGNTVVQVAVEPSALDGLVEDLLAEAQVPPNWAIVFGAGGTPRELIDEGPDRILTFGDVGAELATRARERGIPVEPGPGNGGSRLAFGAESPAAVFASFRTLPSA